MYTTLYNLTVIYMYAWDNRYMYVYFFNKFILQNTSADAAKSKGDADVSFGSGVCYHTYLLYFYLSA